MADISEQWNDIGDCSVCRRKNYCSKPCKRGQMRQQRDIAGAVAGAIIKAWARAEGMTSEE